MNSLLTMRQRLLPSRSLGYILAWVVSVLTVSCGSEPRVAGYQSLLIGVWQERANDLLPGDVPPRMRFEEDGGFRSNNAVGEVRRGTWRWASRNSIVLRWESGPPLELRIRELTSHTLVVGESEPSEFVRVGTHSSRLAKRGAKDRDR